MIAIHTTRCSAVVAAFVQRYPQAVARLDKQIQTAELSTWCTNRVLRSAIDFTLVHNKVELLGFHDEPRHMWAAMETLALVEELAARKMLRFEVPASKTSWLARWLGG
ncbi:MAG: hypothetical protein Q4A11_05335 [Brachymonas sp.]|nr:hypothetical protein [Brachymonas sp.]